MELSSSLFSLFATTTTTTTTAAATLTPSCRCSLSNHGDGGRHWASKAALLSLTERAHAKAAVWKKGDLPIVIAASEKEKEQEKEENEQGRSRSRSTSTSGEAMAATEENPTFELARMLLKKKRRGKPAALLEESYEEEEEEEETLKSGEVRKIIAFLKGMVQNGVNVTRERKGSLTARRMGWLCREIGVLRAPGIMKILKKQKKWMNDDYARQLIYRLLHSGHVLQAYWVHKWMQKQQWYSFDFELNTKLIDWLSVYMKLVRAQELFDEIVDHGHIPFATTFKVLIKAYLKDENSRSIEEAWKLYNQMTQSFNFKATTNLQHSLLKALACPSGRWLNQVVSLFQGMREKGEEINMEMYSILIEVYSIHGEEEKVDELIEDMKERNFRVNLKVVNAMLRACSKHGNVRRAEKLWHWLLALGLEPDWRSHLFCINTYGEAGLPMKSLKTFEQMKDNGITPNTSSYHSIIAVMASALKVDMVEKLLQELEESGQKPLHPCYNAAMDMYMKLGNFDMVESIFDRMKTAGVRPNCAAYNLLISSYIQSAQLDKAELVFLGMGKGGASFANQKTYNLMLNGYGMACLREKADGVFQEMLKQRFELDPTNKDCIQSILSGQ